jgi:hypothetical protein
VLHLKLFKPVLGGADFMVLLGAAESPLLPCERTAQACLGRQAGCLGLAEGKSAEPIGSRALLPLEPVARADRRRKKTTRTPFDGVASCSGSLFACPTRLDADACFGSFVSYYDVDVCASRVACALLQERI